MLRDFELFIWDLVAWPLYRSWVPIKMGPIVTILFGVEVQQTQPLHFKHIYAYRHHYFILTFCHYVLITMLILFFSFSVRNIGALLTERYSSSGSRPSEKELLGLREQFSNIESQLSVTAQHCSGGEATLTKMLAPSTGMSIIPNIITTSVLTKRLCVYAYNL